MAQARAGAGRGAGRGDEARGDRGLRTRVHGTSLGGRCRPSPAPCHGGGPIGGGAEVAADLTARIVTMPTMIAVPITDTVQMKRLTEFAADVAQLVDER